MSDNIKDRVRVGNMILTHLTHRHNGKKDNALLVRIVEKNKNHLRVMLTDGSKRRTPYEGIVDTMDKENLGSSLGQLGTKFKMKEAQ